MLRWKGIFASEVWNCSGTLRMRAARVQKREACLTTPRSSFNIRVRLLVVSQFNTPFIPLRDKNRPFREFWRNSMAFMNVLNREVFDKQTTSIFPSWTSRVRSPFPIRFTRSTSSGGDSPRWNETYVRRLSAASLLGRNP